MRASSLITWVVVVLCWAGLGRGQCVEDWRLGPESAFPGVGGYVRAFTIHDDGRGPALYIAGEFESAGGVIARNIARWDGRKWEALGTDLNRVVRALASYNGELIAGGDFFREGSSTGGAIAKYRRGEGWAPVKDGLSGSVTALLVHEGLLYVGGSFSDPSFPPVGRNFVGWNGSDWVRATSDFATPTIAALTVWNGKIVAAGDGTFGFGTRRSVHVAWLDGASWNTLGGGTGRTVYALTVYNGELVAGGYFPTAGGAAISRVARWDGVSWKAFGSGMPGTGDVLSLAVHDGQLFVGGDFGSTFLRRWDGSAWHSEMGYASDGLGGPVSGIAAMIEFEDRLVLGGGFEAMGTVGGYSLHAYSMAAWDDGTLVPVTGGLEYPVLQLYDDGSDVLAVGEFVLDGWPGVARLADEGGDARWTRLPGEFGGRTRALLRYGGKLVVAGDFVEVNGVTVNRIVRQGDEIGWDALGAGLSKTGSSTTVRALAEFRGELIAGGSFAESGSTLVNRIARWDGAAWQPLGLGLNGTVFAMTVHNDELIVGGSFTIAGGGSALNIAAWDGTSWRAMGEGLDMEVLSLTTFEGTLIASGRFTASGTTPVSRVARWNGTGWEPMGAGIPEFRVTALAVHKGQLFAGALGLWRWNGAAWTRLSTTDYLPGGPRSQFLTINSLLSRGSELLAGGTFTLVDPQPPRVYGRIASFFARWGCAPCKADMDGDGIVDFSDYLMFLNLFDAQDPRADLNGDGIVDFPDYLEFLDAFASGCA